MANAGKSHPKYAWLNGKIVPWAKATIHVRSDVVNHGTSVFEGIRAYWNADERELYIFKMREHMDRFWESMKVTQIPIPYSPEEITRASVALLRKNGFREDIHFRPTAFVGPGEMYSSSPDEAEMGAFITAIPRPQKPTLRTGNHCCVSSWRRISDDTVPPRIKSGANYQNSRLAMLEAKRNGYDNTILLTREGKVAEGPGACLFMVRRGVPTTPSTTSGILESVTRATLIQLFRDELGMEGGERPVARTELYSAEEVFFCGSGAEITPIVSVDKLAVGTSKRGRLTEKIQQVYFDICRGKNPKYREWLTPVYGRSR